MLLAGDTWARGELLPPSVRRRVVVPGRRSDALFENVDKPHRWLRSVVTTIS